MLRRHALAVLCCFALGCSGSSPESSSSSGDGTQPSSPPAAESKGTIGYSALELTNPFFQVIADTMKSESAAAGYELVVVSGERDVKKQADQIDEFIVKGVAAIILIRLAWALTGVPQLGLMRFYPHFEGLRLSTAMTHPAMAPG